jgi:hypothetical protein
MLENTEKIEVKGVENPLRAKIEAIKVGDGSIDLSVDRST